MWMVLMFVMHQGYYWKEIPDQPGWHALMLGNYQVGALDGSTGEYFIRQRNPTAWLGPQEPPVPRPHMNFGVNRDKINEAGEITKNGKPVDRSVVEQLLRRKKPLPLIGGVSPLLLPLSICVGLVVAILFVVILTRRKVHDGS